MNARADKSEDVYLAEERAVLQATELVSIAMEQAGVTRSELARKLSVSRSEITQRLQGTRNLTLRSLADMLHALDHTLVLSAVPEGRAQRTRPTRPTTRPGIGT